MKGQIAVVCASVKGINCIIRKGSQIKREALMRISLLFNLGRLAGFENLEFSLSLSPPLSRGKVRASLLASLHHPLGSSSKRNSENWAASDSTFPSLFYKLSNIGTAPRFLRRGTIHQLHNILLFYTNLLALLFFYSVNSLQEYLFTCYLLIYTFSY